MPYIQCFVFPLTTVHPIIDCFFLDFLPIVINTIIYHLNVFLKKGLLLHVLPTYSSNGLYCYIHCLHVIYLSIYLIHCITIHIVHA